MKRTDKMFFAAAVCVFSFFTTIQAEDNPVSLVIAPPPVGYPAIKAGKTDTVVGINGVYASYSANDFDMTLLGGTAIIERQTCPSDKLALNGSVGITFLGGDQYDLLMAQVPFGGDIIYQVLGAHSWSLFAFGGANGNFGVTNMTITFPAYTTTGTADMIITTTMMTLSGLAGLQANITAGSFIISPFGLATITGGSYSTTMTSNISGSEPVSSSGSIDPVTGIVLGFDILYVPMNLALSSQFHKDSDYTLITVACKWLLQNK